MKIIDYKHISEHSPWCGANYVFEKLTKEDFDILDDILNDLYPEGLTTTGINDIFWFEEDFIAECLGYENWEDLSIKRDLAPF